MMVPKLEPFLQPRDETWHAGDLCAFVEVHGVDLTPYVDEEGHLLGSPIEPMPLIFLGVCWSENREYRKAWFISPVHGPCYRIINDASRGRVHHVSRAQTIASVTRSMHHDT